jgi:ABC-2 type transport system ATP-binding protein
LLGKDFWSTDRLVRQRVAYVAQSSAAPEWMSLEDLWRYNAHFYDRWDPALAQSLARRWEIPSDRPLGRLSGGTRRLAALLVALAVRPEVLILDEPAAGLDPISRREVLGCLVEALLATDGCTILLSTHLLGDLERLASHVGMMEHGRIVAEGPVEEWKRTMRRVQVVFPGATAPPGVEIPGALRTQILGPVITAVARVTEDTQMDALRGLPGVRVNEFPLSLEELFVELFQPDPALGVDEASAEDPVGNPDRPGGRVTLEPKYRVGRGPMMTVAPAPRDRDD